MKTDTYTKTVLTVIALLLGVIAFKNETVIPTAHASSNTNNNSLKFATVPLNPDGSINVKITDEIDVNIEEVGGWSVSSSGIPVIIKQNNDK